MKNKNTRLGKIDTICEPQSKDFDGLRNILFDELNLLRQGKVTVGRARTVSQLSRRIIEAATLDLFAQGQLSGQKIRRLMSNNVQG